MSSPTTGHLWKWWLSFSPRWDWGRAPALPRLEKEKRFPGANWGTHFVERGIHAWWVFKHCEEFERVNENCVCVFFKRNFWTVWIGSFACFLLRNGVLFWFMKCYCYCCFLMFVSWHLRLNKDVYLFTVFFWIFALRRCGAIRLLSINEFPEVRPGRPWSWMLKKSLVSTCYVLLPHEMCGRPTIFTRYNL